MLSAERASLSWTAQLETQWTIAFRGMYTEKVQRFLLHVVMSCSKFVRQAPCPSRHVIEVNGRLLQQWVVQAIFNELAESTVYYNTSQLNRCDH